MLICEQYRKTLSMSSNMHLFLPNYLNDSHMNGSVIHFFPNLSLMRSETALIGPVTQSVEIGRLHSMRQREMPTTATV